MTLRDIIKEGKDGDYLAFGDDGKDYKVKYSAKYKVMFFAIPDGVEILGYSKVVEEE